ncbi:hypothetical protein AYJ03_003980 [Mycobacterium tuberculosis]|nr:hypothetical protein [Mycobacterium tuberculosis]MXI68710.1 hypothetical protein [Mycobacterium tuberculosis]QGK78054.1 hypothetical protein GJE03_03985 [Mycobacterium tuberculosis]QGR99877.1 hypothetical protein FOC59_18420 [Mycobacterium tuberculosis]QGS03407.1 hypothetical protein FOC58_15855 [Mycobacterium tuberculosis]
MFAHHTVVLSTPRAPGRSSGTPGYRAIGFGPKPQEPPPDPVPFPPYQPKVWD